MHGYIVYSIVYYWVIAVMFQKDESQQPNTPDAKGRGFFLYKWFAEVRGSCNVLWKPFALGDRER